MVTILAAAENFAFGPAGKLLTIAPQLKARGHRLHFVGFGTAFDLISQGGSFDEVYELDTEDPTSQPAVLRLLASADVVVSCMDRGIMSAARVAKVPSIWIDSLFYWWESLPLAVLSADCFIKQDVLPDQENLAKYSAEITNLLSVGPIVEDFGTKAKAQVKNRALVCFGGMEAPGWYEAGKNHNYPFTISRLLRDQVNFDDFDEVVVTGSSKIISNLSEKYPHDKFRFVTLSHPDFIQTLRESRVALLAGGLETSLEAFQYGVPAIFLPPLNVTHHLQVGALRGAGVALASIHFSDYFDPFDWKTASRREKVAQFLERLRLFESSEEMLEDVAIRITSWLRDERLHGQQRLAQSQFLEGLKPNGLEDVVNAIHNVAARLVDSAIGSRGQ